MLYLLDANVLITAHNNYYPVHMVPEFWSWLVHKAKLGEIKMPIETLEEVLEGGSDSEADALYGWLQDDDNRSALLLQEDVQGALVRQVVAQYATDLTDVELEALGRDPFLIAYGLARPSDRWVVTTESSARGKQRQNRRIPDVCADLGIRCCNTFAMNRQLGFHTAWRG